MPHPPIKIEGDNDFTFENGVVAGNGSVEDPYLISGWKIENASYGILIENVTKSFILSNITIVNISDYGIRFFNISAKNIIIECVNIISSSYGIYLEEKPQKIAPENQNFVIRKTKIIYCDTGLFIGYPSNEKKLTTIKQSKSMCKVSVDNSTFYANKKGAVVDIWEMETYFTFNQFSQNEIALEGDIFEFSNNHIFENSYGLFATSGNISNNLIYNNIKEGCVIIGQSEIANNKIYQNQGDAIHILTPITHKIQISGNEIFSNVGVGINFSFSQHPQRDTGYVLSSPLITIQNNQIYNNRNGISMHDVFGILTQIYNNNISANEENGIVLTRCGGIDIYNNKIISNKMCGVLLIYCSHIINLRNVFANPLLQASEFNSSGLNIWNLTSEGNYWSDWQSPDNNYDGIVD
ncbi:MAG: right-handed parallel beta-helix repeat-containing protein, partial [Thermoplasmata archaeon]